MVVRCSMYIPLWRGGSGGMVVVVWHGGSGVVHGVIWLKCKKTYCIILFHSVIYHCRG